MKKQFFVWLAPFFAELLVDTRWDMKMITVNIVKYKHIILISFFSMDEYACGYDMNWTSDTDSNMYLLRWPFGRLVLALSNVGISYQLYINGQFRLHKIPINYNDFRISLKSLRIERHI